VPQFSVTACGSLLTALLKSGCGSTGAENAAHAAKALKPSPARFRVQRSNELMAAAPAARVKLDGRKIASLGVGRSATLTSQSGAQGHRRSAKPPQRVYDHPASEAGRGSTLEVSPRGEAVTASRFGIVSVLAEACINQNGGTFLGPRRRDQPAKHLMRSRLSVGGLHRPL
jgi:hypothetical protein